MPFDFFSSAGDFASFSDIGSVVDNFGTEFISSDFTTTFNVPLPDVASLGGFEQVGSFAGNADWFDTFNVGSITSAAGSLGDSISTGFSSISDSLPSLSSIKDVAGTVSDSISTGYNAVKDALPSLDQIKTYASTVEKTVSGYVKTAQSVVTAYNKVAPAVNVASAAFGIPNPINQIIQPVTAALSVAGGVSSAAGGIAKAADSAAKTDFNLFGPSPTDRAETYNQAVQTVNSTDVALKQYDADKQAATADILKTSDNLYSLQSQLDDPTLSDEARKAIEADIQAQQEKLAVAQKVVEQTDSAIAQVTTARDSAAKIVATTDLKTIKAPYVVDETGLVILTKAQTAELEKKNLKPGFVDSLVDTSAPKTETYNQAVETVKSTEAALKQYDADKKTATSDISKISDNIYNIQQRLEDPATTTEERALLEEQQKGEYDKLAEAQMVLEQTNTAITQVSAARDAAAEIVTSTTLSSIGAAAPVLDKAVNTFKSVYNSITGKYSIFNTATNTTVATGLDQASADKAIAAFGITAAATTLNATANAVATGVLGLTTTNTIVAPGGAGTDIAGLVSQARSQQSIRDLRNNKAQSTDWRVRLRLAPGATYLYNDPNGPGILTPLSDREGTGGVIFPYTPAIETAYKANYESYDLTHSNYRGYFYKGSYVDALNMRCTFTAQDTTEANYLLAVIHFFRSVTKMFYGQDSERGSPPPLVFLSGLGDYQFNEHPCVVNQFNYTLPPDVDYIRAYSALDMSTNLLDNRTRTTISSNPLSYGINRLLNSGLFQGAQPSTLTVGNLPIKQPTYVPTKMEMSISLLPMQSRQQVSTQFSLKGFANGNLLKGGFW